MLEELCSSAGREFQRRFCANSSVFITLHQFHLCVQFTQKCQDERRWTEQKEEKGKVKSPQVCLFQHEVAPCSHGDGWEQRRNQTHPQTKGLRTSSAPPLLFFLSVSTTTTHTDLTCGSNPGNRLQSLFRVSHRFSDRGQDLLLICLRDCGCYILYV